MPVGPTYGDGTLYTGPMDDETFWKITDVLGVGTEYPRDSSLGIVEVNNGVTMELEVVVIEELLRVAFTGATSEELLVSTGDVVEMTGRLVLYGATIPVVVIVSTLVEVVELPVPKR